MIIKLTTVIVLSLSITIGIFAAKEEDNYSEKGSQDDSNTYGVSPSPPTYYFGYDSKDKDDKDKDVPRLMREEVRLSDGTVTGRYGYTDPFGMFRVVKYVSGNTGYYATEEIGEQVTSSTPLYFKATAPQVDTASEQPDSYGIELATKFNPPLYHPEAHTMDYRSDDSSKLINTDDSDLEENSGQASNPIVQKVHQIFSLSNSEDLLERQYRERKQLERHLSEIQKQKEGTNSQTTGQVFSKPVGVLVATTRRPIRHRVVRVKVNSVVQPSVSTDDDLRRVTGADNNKTDPNYKESVFNFDVNHIIQPKNISDVNRDNNINNSVNNNNTNKANYDFRSNYNNFGNLEIYLKNNVSKTKSSNTLRNRPIIHREQTFSATTTTAKPDYAIHTTAVHLPEDQQHLYFNPTREPTVSFVTSVSREIHEVVDERNNNTSEVPNNESEYQSDLWTRLRDRFIHGSTEPSISTATPTSPPPTTTITTTTERPKTRSTKPIGSSYSERINHQTNGEPHEESVSPFFERAGIEEFRAIHEDMNKEVEEEPKYLDKNFYFETLREKPFERLVDNKDKSNDNRNNDNWFEILSDNIRNNNSKDNTNNFKNNTNHLINKVVTEIIVESGDQLRTTTLKPITSPITTTTDMNNLSTRLFGIDITAGAVENRDKPITPESTKSAFDWFANSGNRGWKIGGDILGFTTTTSSPIDRTTISSSTTFTTTSNADNNQSDGSNTTDILKRFFQRLRQKSPNDDQIVTERSVSVSVTETPIETIYTTPISYDQSVNSEPQGKSINSSHIQFFDEFFQNFNEKTIMYSEAQVDNQTLAPLETTTAANGLQSTTITTSTDGGTESPTTKTNSEVISNEFLDNFWHNYNDNSDEYFVPIVADNKSTNETQYTTTSSTTITTTSTTTTGAETKTTTTVLPTETSSEDILLESISRKQIINVNKSDNSLIKNDRQDLDTLEDTNHPMNIMADIRLSTDGLNETKVQYIPPLQALFGFPQQIKRVRKVQKHRLRQPESDREVITTTTLIPETTFKGIDIIATDASESDPKLSTTAMEPMERTVAYYSPVTDYSQQFDDISTIVTTIQLMKKPNQMTTISSEVPMVTEFVTTEANNNDNNEPKDLPTNQELISKISSNNELFKAQPKYLLPIEPIGSAIGSAIGSDTESVQEFTTFESNTNKPIHKYEPYLKFES